MWPFNKISTPPSRKKLEEFEETLNNLERRVKSVELD
jgi:hypothetical protein